MISAGAGLGLILSVTATAATPLPPSLAWQYDFKVFLYPGAVESYPLGINENRDIAGFFMDKAGSMHGYLYSNGIFTPVDYPGALGTFAGGINDRGDISGTYVDTKGFQHGYIRMIPPGCERGDDRNNNCKPVFKSIDVPGAQQDNTVPFEFGPGLGTDAIGINNRQDMVGLYATGVVKKVYSAGFMLSNGHYQAIEDPLGDKTPGDGTKLFGINDFGVIAGDYLTGPADNQITHGFIFDGHTFKSVFVPGSDQGGFGTQANGINLQGEVVGTFTDTAGVLHGLFWANGQAFTLDYPGQLYSEVHVINNRGDVTGAYYDLTNNGNLVGYVAFKKDR